MEGCSSHGGALFGPWYVLKTQHMQANCITEIVVKCFSGPEQTAVQFSAKLEKCSRALIGPWYVLKTQHMQEGCITERIVTVVKCFSGPEQSGGAVLSQY